MPIKLSGSTSGYSQLQAAAVAASNTLTLPASNGTILSDDGSGNVTITGSAYLATTSGNVGVGTATPLQKFTAVNTATSGGGPASSGSAADPNATSRFQYASVVTDFGVYAAGQVWMQNRLATNYATNFDLVLNPNGGNVQVGGTTVANTAGYVNSRTNARAWCNFNGTLAGPITPRSNYNISSVTKNSTGNYTLNFTTALADANYSVTASANLATGVSWVSAPYSGGTKSTSAVQIAIVNNGAFADLSDISVTIFGN